jgi:hypothetical protein
MNFEELEKLETEILAEYNERYRARPYRTVFFRPAIGRWKVDVNYVDSFFESAKFLLEVIVAGELPEYRLSTTGVLPETAYGVVAVYLCRHYLELEIKYTLFHSRWLKHEHTNAADPEIDAVDNIHTLHDLWEKMVQELKARAPSIFDSGLDLKFVAAFVADFHRVDKEGWRFRYPRKRIAIVSPEEPPADVLGIDYASLLFNLKRAHDVLDTLDGRLVDQHGENEDWQSQLEDF